MNDDLQPRQDPSVRWKASERDGEMKFVVHRWPDGEITLALDRNYSPADIEAL